MQFDAIVPAYNESSTVADVVTMLSGSSYVSKILVADDGSSDGTSIYASVRGASVVKIYPNGGKGAAMRLALSLTSTEYVGFFDADLLGLCPAHIDRLVEIADAGFDMVCGLRDYGVVGNLVQLNGPVITGERLCRRQMLERIPESCWSGYAIETAMNDVCRRHGYRTALTILPGLHIRNKIHKAGFIHGMLGHWRMTKEIYRTRKALEQSNGTCCTEQLHRF